MSDLITQESSVGILMQWLLDAQVFKKTFLSRGIPKVVISTHHPVDFENFFAEAPVSVALIDIRIPNQVGIDLGRRLLATRNAAQVLFLDREYGIFRRDTATAMGAEYCCRNMPLSQLATVVVEMAQTGRLDKYSREMLSTTGGSTRFDPRHEKKLTQREIEVWSLIAEGLSVADCAKRLGIRESTADNHKSRLMKKLKVNKSLELVRLAIKQGIVDL